MKNTERKRVAGAGLYIVLAACVLSAMTINVVHNLSRTSAGAENDVSPVDLSAQGVTDTEEKVTVQSAPVVKEASPAAKAPLKAAGEIESDAKADDDGEKTEDDKKAQDADGKESDGVYYTFIQPVEGTAGDYNGETIVYSKTFGDYRVHEGVDIAAEAGAKVMAFASGTISQIYDDAMMGKTIVIDHGSGLSSVYKNLADELPEGVTVGADVKTGDVIASVGASAIAECADEPHLHFEVCFNETNVDPTAYFMNDK